MLGLACDDLVARGVIPSRKLSFVAAVAGTGSLVGAVQTGTIQGFEFSTPLDDVSQLFTTADNPGTVGVRYVHVPGDPGRPPIYPKSHLAEPANCGGSPGAKRG